MKNGTWQIGIFLATAFVATFAFFPFTPKDLLSLLGINKFLNTFYYIIFGVMAGSGLLIAALHLALLLKREESESWESFSKILRVSNLVYTVLAALVFSAFFLATVLLKRWV